MLARVLVLGPPRRKHSDVRTRKTGLPEPPDLGHLFLPSLWPLCKALASEGEPRGGELGVPRP